jgi:uncharacterized protein
MIWLTAAFLATALLYASVGFGGGSTYNALLALSGIDFRILPTIALICNIIVVTGGTVRFARAGLVPWRRAVPLVLISAPLAWLGGFTPIKESLFLAILAASLAIAGLMLLLQREAGAEPILAREGEGRFRGQGKNLLICAGLGYLAGLVGIGGGIFLAPYLHFTRWATARQVAATASFFILVNSLAGLAGQFQKLAGNNLLPEIWPYWPLALAVLIGGQIGSFIGIRLLSPILVRRVTAILILYVAAQLTWKLVTA